MPDPTDGLRRCTSCDAELPAERSVCPACGTLQPRRAKGATAKPRTIGPIPVEPPTEPGVGEFPGLPPERGERRGPLALPPSRTAALGPTTPTPASAPDAEPSPAPAPPPPSERVEPVEPVPSEPVAAAHGSAASVDPDDGEADWDDEPRRSPILAVATVVVAALLIGAVALIVLERDDEPAPSASPDRVEAVRSFCASPHALGDDVAPYDPTKAGIAYVQAPQPPSATEPDDELVVQVAPTLGDPVLTLEASVGLVNVAMCLDEGVTSPAGGTCRFELTTAGQLGEEVERPLERTSYEATLYELRTGEELSSGPISTPTDRCPQFAFTDGSGVSTPLSPTELMTWLGANLPTGA